MSGANFSRVKNWNAGDTLTASDLNGEFNNILTNLNPAGLDGQSDTLAAMQATANPYSGGSPSEATSLMQEIQQIRYMLGQITGQSYWYLPPAGALAPVGSVLEYELATEPTGWLFLDGETIGDASSGATARANADQATLFAGLWAAQDNTMLVIQDSSGNPTTRGANAAADFAAHKRLPLPNRCGRVSIGAGQGNTAEGGGTGTNRVLGVSGGAETHTQASGEVGSHTHTDSGHTHAPPTGYADFVVANSGSYQYNNQSGGSGVFAGQTPTFSGTANIQANAAPSAMTIMNPLRVTNHIIKY